MQMRKTNSAARLPMRAVVCTIAVAVGVAASTVSAASDHPFPSKPITLIVPGGPGGALDLTARALAAEASKTLGQPIIIDLKPGGTQTLGPATMAASAKPDGHTLSLVVSTIVRVPLMQKVAFDPFADFTYILQVCAVTIGIVTASDQPFQTSPMSLPTRRRTPAS